MGASFFHSWIDLKDGRVETVRELFKIHRLRVQRLTLTTLLYAEFFEQFSPSELVEDESKTALEETKVCLLESLRVIETIAAGNVYYRDVVKMWPPRSYWTGNPTILLVTGDYAYERGEMCDQFHQLDLAGILDLSVTDEIILEHRVCLARAEFPSEEIRG